MRGGVAVRGQTDDIMGKDNDHAMYLKTSDWKSTVLQVDQDCHSVKRPKDNRVKF